MTKHLHGTATERIPFGALVLCRGMRVSLAPPEIANARAGSTPPWGRKEVFEPGDHMMVEKIEGLGERDIHALANGPIMEPLRLFLPAGKLTEAEYQQRLDLQFSEAGIERSI